ncbi:MAG TPA: hypothetical protein VJJ25_04200 [Nitrosopumilaceae archaeon]|nr:hypothetical protein [Nitrosopumilaceae archaeon]
MNKISKILPLTLVAIVLASGFSFQQASAAVSGNFFLTCHDPDFHSSLGGNAAGAKNIIKKGVDFIQDPAFNTFVSGGLNYILFVESKISPPGGHTKGVNGFIAAGYVSGTDFELHDATDLNAELDLLGTKYSSIVVASDFGGVLTQAELDILIARSPDIVTFLNAGGGIYVMAESNLEAGLTPDGGHFSFLPFVTTSTPLNQGESGNVVTAFGASLGLVDADVNGNASHCVFDGLFGLNLVDFDPSDRKLSLAGRILTPDAIGGEIISLDKTALLLAGVQSSFIWIMPAIIVGVGVVIFKLKRN